MDISLYTPGQRVQVVVVVDQVSTEVNGSTGELERFLYAVYDKTTGKLLGHSWLNKTKDSIQLQKYPFGTVVEFETEIGPYRARDGRGELLNISGVTLVRKPTLQLVQVMHTSKDEDRVKNGHLHPTKKACRTCGKPAKDTRWRGCANTGRFVEFCSEKCRTAYLSKTI